MKKSLFIAITIMAATVALSSCTRGMQGVINNWTYTSPSQIGGTWTVIQGSTTITGCKCLYWSTDDDDSCFVKDGKKIFVNGSSIIIQE